jgi:hypothetical protein
MSLGQLMRVSDANIMPDKLHRFAKRTADCKLEVEAFL